MRHFVTLIEIHVHLIRVNPGHIWGSSFSLVSFYPSLAEKNVGHLNGTCSISQKGPCMHFILRAQKRVHTCTLYKGQRA